MKERLLFVVAIISHPILLMPLLFFGLNQCQFNKDFQIVLWFSLIIPAAIYKMSTTNLVSPSLGERRKIYLVLAICYALISFYLTEKEPEAAERLFLPFAFGLLVMSIASLYSKWSWHAFAWASAIYPMIDLGLTYDLMQNYGSLIILCGIFIGLTVSYVRYLQKAHTLKELFLGYLCGALVPYICFICMDI